MKNQNLIKELHTLWLPIIHFETLLENIEQLIHSTLKPSKNTNWQWITFTYKEFKITIDSLGYFYIESENFKNEKILFDTLEKILENTETKTIIEESFMNRQIGFFDTITFQNFLTNIRVKITPKAHNIQLEHIESKLSYQNVELDKIKNFKFSLQDTDQVFHTILNRELEKTLQKSIYYTHGLKFDEGEIYSLSLIENYKQLIDNFDSFEEKITITINSGSSKEENILQQVIQKAIQDTIEERTILHFLNITEKEYLIKIVNKISKANEFLQRRNSYLLENINIKNFQYKKNTQVEEELNSELFIQNLLQSIPKFDAIESKLKEAYYIKIGNSTTNISVQNDETITNTLFFHKWKASIAYFINTARNAKESLTMYHQNKTLKELQDMGYNANYQADIKDIRDLQNRKDISFDNKTTWLILGLGIVTLSGEAPIVHFIEPFAWKGFWSMLGGSIIEVIINTFIYFLIVHGIARHYLFKKETWFTKIIKMKERFVNGCMKDNPSQPLKAKETFNYEELDYDKHEHRSSQPLYTYEHNDKGESNYKKLTLKYNDTLSAYTLSNKIKKQNLKKIVTNKPYTFNLFPSLLKDEEKSHNNTIYKHRENYRISRSDKVTTKLMFHYKIANIELGKFLEFIHEDAFVQYYKHHIEKEKKYHEASLVDLENYISCLKDSELLNESKLTFYIVYSFSLNLENNESNNYTYSVLKDQFRVHYHINRLDYNRGDYANLKDKQEALAQLIYIYFLARLKKFD